MNVSDFYKYIEHPELLNASTVAELQEVLEVYPYFQTAHVLYLKSLYNQNNFKFNEQLKFSSVHINNRKKLLFYLKEKTKVVENEILVISEKQSTEDVNESLVEISEIKEENNAFVESDKQIELNDDLLVEDTINIEEETNNISVSISDNTTLMIGQILGGLQQNESKDDKKESIDFAKENNAEINEGSDEESLKELNEEKIELIDSVERQPELIVKDLEVEIKEELKVTGTVDEGNIEIEEKKSEVVKEPTKFEQNLSPQEIIQKRIQEIRSSKAKEKLVKPEIKEKIVPFDEVGNKADNSQIKAKVDDGLTSKNIAIIEDAKKLAKDIKNDSDKDSENIIKQANTEEETDVLSEITELIAVSAPSNYFLTEEKSVEKESATVVQMDTVNEKHSFSDWLTRLSKAKETKVVKAEINVEPIVEPTNMRLKNINKGKKSHLIESFLSDTKSKVIKPSPSFKGDTNKQSELPQNDEGVSLMTETLAEIYIQQAYYEKAIEAYRKLSLKYPKKNTYFASQIEKVKKLQLNS